MKLFKRVLSFAAGIFAAASVSAAVGTGPGGLFIQSQNTLQPNATFYVSSGTARNFNTNAIKFSDGTTQVTAATSGGGASTLQVMVNGVQITSPTTSIRFDANFIGANPSVGISSVSLSPNSTFYIRNGASLQTPGQFNVSSATVSGQFLVATSRYNLFFAPSSTQAFQIINKSSEAAFILFSATNTARWRFGADPKVLQARDFGLYNELTGIYTIQISSSDAITLNGNVTISGLTASMPVKTNSSKQLVSGLIDVTADITGTVPSGNLPTNVSYNNVQQTVSVNKVYSASQTFNSDVVVTALPSEDCVGTDSTGKLIAGTCTGGGGGGGASTLAVGTGTASNFTNNVTSPTAAISFHGNLFRVTTAGTTSFVNIDTATANGLLMISSAAGTYLTRSSATATYLQVETGDISAVTAGSGLSGGGTSGAVTISLDPNATHYIHNQNTLQSGATFYVSSGTVNGNFYTNGDLHIAPFTRFSGADFGSGIGGFNLSGSNGSGGYTDLIAAGPGQVTLGQPTGGTSIIFYSPLGYQNYIYGADIGANEFPLTLQPPISFGLPSIVMLDEGSGTNNMQLMFEAAGSTGTLNWDGAAFTFANDANVPDEAYGSGWNGSLEIPTKNALYDKIETISGGGGGGGSALEVFSNFDGLRSSPTASIALGDAMKLTVSGSTAVITVDQSSVTLKGQGVAVLIDTQTFSGFNTFNGSTSFKSPIAIATGTIGAIPAMLYVVGSTRVPAMLVNSISAPSTREQVLKAQLSDGGNGSFFAYNGTSLDGTFAPSFAGYQDSSNNKFSMQIAGFISSANDASDSYASGIVRISGLTTTSATDPINGTSANPSNRKIFAVGGNTDDGSAEYLQVTALGNTTIGGTTNSAQLHVNQNLNTERVVKLQAAASQSAPYIDYLDSSGVAVASVSATGFHNFPGANGNLITCRSTFTVSGGTLSINSINYRFPNTAGTTGQILVNGGESGIQTLAWRDDEFSLGTVFNGSGSTITQYSTSTAITVPYNCVVSSWVVTGSTGSIRIDVRRTAYNSYTGSSGTTSIVGAGTAPGYTVDVKGRSAPSSWTSTTLNADDVIQFGVTSVTNVTEVSIVLKCKKTY